MTPDPRAPETLFAASTSRDLALLGLVTAGYFTTTTDSQMMPPLLTAIRGAMPEWGGDIALLIPVWSVMATLTSLMAGAPLDRWGSARVLPAAFGIFLLGQAIAGVSQTFGMLLASRAVAGIGAGMLSLTLMLRISDVFDASRQDQAFGWFSAGAAAAPLAGLPLVSLLEETFGWRAPFRALMLATLSLMVVSVQRVSLGSGAIAGRGEKRAPLLPFGAYREFLRNRHLASVLALGLVFNSGAFAILSVFGLWCQDRFGLSTAAIFTYYVLGGISALAAALLVGRIARRAGTLRTISWSTASLGIVGFILPFTPNASVLLVLFVLCGALIMLRLVPYHSLTVQAPEPEMRGRFVGLRNAVAQGGIAVGSFLGWLLYVRMGWGFVPIGIIAGLTSFAVLPILGHIGRQLSSESEIVPSERAGDQAE